ncbi:MAG: pentapeptide repeat-containing protein, partial [Desulfobacteraceae bacterium]|nr:pentapeptide repeat-containing protein [Desulfobacteraceae bacterium]
GEKANTRPKGDIKGELKIMDSTVRGAVRAYSPSRKDRVVFTRAVHLEHVTFEPKDTRSISVRFAEFVEGINLNFARFKGNVVFDEVLFKGPVNLFGSRFRAEKDESEQYRAVARFIRCEFKSAVNFESAIFTTTRFKGSSFNSDVILRRVSFKEMSFESEPHRPGIISGNVVLTDAEGDKLKLSSLTIGQDLDLSRSVFPADGSLNLKETAINKSFRLCGARIPKTVQIYGSTIGQNLDLRNANVENNEKIKVKGSRLRIVCTDLKTVIVPPKLTWWMIPWTKPGNLRFSGLEDPIASLRNIENDLRKEGNLADANKAMYIRYHLASDRVNRSIPFRVLFWICDHLLGLGIRPMKVISSGVMLIIGFGIFFYWRIQEKTIDDKWGLWLTKLPMCGDCHGPSRASRLRRIWWAMGLSTVLFVKANFGGMYRVRNGLAIAKIEWILGAIWIMVFIYSLSGRHDTVELIVDALL